MNPPYYDIAIFLQRNGFGTLGADLFGGEWGYETDNDGKIIDIDKQVLVLQGVATPSDLKGLYEQPTLQFLVRGDRFETDLEVNRRAYEIFRFFLNLPETNDINGCIYKGFEEVSSLLQLGKDDNDRFIYSFNLSTYRGV